ncbi:hypothetical protein CEXT_763401 [Caerostris extrusa]|uniref:Uncharacterized protein n=1 Tax=Caerostris extrusa TaxID=172846 RepID=A0AAV4MGZ8_CAEEX|nr:hypothetical protein CEXT_763401 [Caerostris extrusa]
MLYSNGKFSPIMEVPFEEDPVKHYETIKQIQEHEKPEFIVGHGNLGLSETSMSEKLQQRKLKDFRENELMFWLQLKF